MTTLTPIDQYGRPLVRAVLRDEPTPEIIDALRWMLVAARVPWTVDDVAAELGMRLQIPTAAPVARGPRRPPSKRRAA